MVILKPVRLTKWDSTDSGNWLKNSLQQDSQVSIEEETLSYPQLVCQYIGVPLDYDEYFALLYTQVEQAEGKLIILTDRLNKVIPSDKLQSINALFDIHKKEKGLSPNRMVAFMDGHALLPRLKDPQLNRHLRLVLISVLTKLQSVYSEGTLHHEYRRITIDLIKWIFNHVEPALNELDFQTGLPGFLWYGEATPSERWFLAFLAEFGFHVVVFNPLGEQWPAEMLGIQEEQSFKFPKIASELKPLPTEKPDVVGTVAFQATQEINELLHHDNSGLYKPFQLNSFLVDPLRLKTTEDEAFLLAKERAMVRPRFAAANGIVTLPVIFAKMMGIDQNRKRFWSNVHSLTEREDTHVIREFPFTKEQKANPLFHYRDALGRDGKLDPEKMKRANWWDYGKLPPGTQAAIGEAIARHVDKPLLIRQSHETDEELKLFAFAQSMQLPAFALRLLQLFDYPQFVPTIFIYNEETGPDLSRADANALCMMHQLGFDIIAVNPKGHQDIERWIREGVYDLHWLSDRSFNEPFKEQGAVQKMLKRFL